MFNRDSLSSKPSQLLQWVRLTTVSRRCLSRCCTLPVRQSVWYHAGHNTSPTYLVLLLQSCGAINMFWQGHRLSPGHYRSPQAPGKAHQNTRRTRAHTQSPPSPLAAVPKVEDASTLTLEGHPPAASCCSSRCGLFAATTT